jgi:putative hydrolase of the HAD superfamily
VVLLDVGETLIGPMESFGAIYARVLAGLGMEIPVESLERSLRQTWDEFDREIPPGKDRYRHFAGGEDGFWLRYAGRAIARAADRPVRDGIVARALPQLRAAFFRPAAWRVYGDVRPALDALRAAGVRLGVVSNWDSRLPRLLRMLELDSYFEAVAVSHAEGVEKPDPALFRVALGRLGVDAADAFYVGDRPHPDLEGARAAGIDAALVDRRGKLDRSLPTIPDLSPLPGIAKQGTFS